MIALFGELDFMQWLLVTGLGLFVALLVYCQMQKDTFDLRHLIVNAATQQVDRDAFVFIGGWIIASWIMIYYASNLKLNEWWIALYMGLCMAPKLVAQFISAKFGASSSVASTTTTSTVEVTK